MSSFKIYKDVSYDTVTSTVVNATKYGSTNQAFDLALTGPYDITVVCTFTKMGNIGLLSIPAFGNTAVSPIDIFLGTLPGYFNGWVGTVSAPIKSNGTIVTGSITVAGSSIILKNETGNFTNSSGLGSSGWISVPVIFRE